MGRGAARMPAWPAALDAAWERYDALLKARRADPASVSLAEVVAARKAFDAMAHAAGVTE